MGSEELKKKVKIHVNGFVDVLTGAIVENVSDEDEKNNLIEVVVREAEEFFNSTEAMMQEVIEEWIKKNVKRPAR